jgi:hypothetical protein
MRQRGVEGLWRSHPAHIKRGSETPCICSCMDDEIIMIFSRNIVTAETAEYDNCEQAGMPGTYTSALGTDIY